MSGRIRVVCPEFFLFSLYLCDFCNLTESAHDIAVVPLLMRERATAAILYIAAISEIPAAAVLQRI